MDIERFRGSYDSVEKIRSYLTEIILQYGCATVADYYDLIGHYAEWTDNKKGWISMQNAEIVMTDEIGVYELVLPKPYPIE